MSAQPLSSEELLIAQQPRSGRILCPWCAHQRKKSTIPTLSIDLFEDRAVYNCHHCGADGCVPFSRIHRDNNVTVLRQRPAKVVSIPTPLNESEQAIKTFFARRGVTLNDMSKLPPIVAGMKYFYEAQREVPAIGFVYGSAEQPSAIKWRALARKAFMQDGAARSFYGLDQLNPEETTLIIVEGEADVIALASIGIPAISVPNGAPKELSNRRVRPEDDGKFGYVWESKVLLEAAERIILAVDNDEPGQALAEEIARRVGRAKCWQLDYPEGCKDVTDVLAKHSDAGVRSLLENAQPMPLQGVYTANDYSGRVLDVYRNGLTKGLSTGYPDLDNLFTINDGRLSIWTGYPGSGKSELIDQIAINLARNNHWKFAVASFENPPHIHIAKLAEKVIGKPFHSGPTPRMEPHELQSAIEWLNKHFLFLESKDGGLPTVESIMDRTKQAVMRLGVRGLIVDPYNYIHRDKNTAEYEWISEVLTQMSNFAKSHDLHIFFVAHPQKQQPREDGTYPVPKGQQISGSAAWFAKADLGITVHRGTEGAEVHCWKVRFKWEGQIGACMLDYDIVTGRYSPHVNYRKATTAAVHKHWQDDERDPFDLPF